MPARLALRIILRAAALRSSETAGVSPDPLVPNSNSISSSSSAMASQLFDKKIREKMQFNFGGY